MVRTGEGRNMVYMRGYKALAVPAGLIVFLVLMGFAGRAAGADKRVALVIGNAAYTQEVARLKNPGNDATAVAAALRRLGFKVIEGRELDRNGFFDYIAAFDAAARSAELALFFYAGHGLQVDGRNYLAPVDLKLETRQDLRRHAIELAAVLEVMQSETNLVILDACRNNPLAGDLARTLGMSRAAAANRGLARVESAMGALIAYATEPGDVAADGTGEHSPYTAALLAHIETPGLSVNDLFTEVTASVLASTGGKQKPWTHSSLSKIARLVPTPVDPVPRACDRELDLEYWRSVKDSRDAADYEAYLLSCPQGQFVRLARNRLQELRRSDTPPVEPGTTAEAERRREAKSVEASLKLIPPDRKLIQSALKAEGFYAGPVDGKFGLGTRGAISRWQVSRGEEVTGHLGVESSKILLASGREREAKELVGTASLNQGLLQDAMETVSKALVAVAAQRIESPGSGVFRDIATAQAEAGNLRDAKQSFSEAVAATKMVENDDRRAEALHRIARAQADTGYFQDALATAQRIKEGSHSRANAFIEIARAQAEAGNLWNAKQSLAMALAATQGIEKDLSRERKLADIASAQADVGGFRDAVAIAQQIEEFPYTRSWTYLDIATAQAEAGNHRDAKQSFSEALATAQPIEDDYQRAVAFTSIAKAQAEAGNFGEALATAQRIEDDYQRAVAFASIAKAQAEAGNFGEALATAQRIEDDYQRAVAFASIAKAQAEAGNFGEALATAQRIEMEDWYGHRAEALHNIAAAQAEAGNHRDAKQSFSEALAAAQRIESPNRAGVFRDIATAQAEAGNLRDAKQSFSEAVAATKMVENDDRRAEALYRIARAQADTGYFQDALATAQRIKEGSHSRADAFIETARAQAEAGNLWNAKQSLAMALAATQGITWYPHHMGSILRIARAQAEAGNLRDAKQSFSKALETAERLEDPWSRIASFICIARVQAGERPSSLGYPALHLAR